MKRTATFLMYFGSLMIACALIILLALLYQPILQELHYNLSRPNSHAAVNANTHDAHAIHPISKDFGIVIPKIAANAAIIPQVDPYNSHAYQVALTHGIAQAQGTTYPYENGNMFLFAHSAANALEATQYNAIFYLLTKLQPKDAVFVFYKGQKYTYEITGSSIVDPENITYLTKGTSAKTLTLMTCWPAGTSFKRLLVFAKQV